MFRAYLIQICKANEVNPYQFSTTQDLKRRPLKLGRIKTYFKNYDVIIEKTLNQDVM
jgi:hypothetical protein